MLSFWEKDVYLEYDVIIIGAGITGLSTAISLLEKNNTLKVLLLERGLLPTGASTKNAGFACFGSITEIIADLKTMSTEEVLYLIEERYKGLLMLRQRLGDDVINYEPYGGYDLILNEDISIDDRIGEINLLLKDIFKKPVFELQNKKIKEFGFNEDRVSSLVFNSYEGQIHPGKMIKALTKIAAGLGATILTGAEVMEFKESSDSVIIETKNQNGETLKFRCKSAAFCTNAFTKNFFPDMDVIPGRGQVIMTKPIPELKFKGTFHVEEGFYYFRNVANRVLLGGGRNLDMKTEETIELVINELIVSALKEMLNNIILPGKPYRIEHHWTGIMAFGEKKLPIVKQVSDRIFVAARMSGMGIALGSRVGERLSGMIIENQINH